ncbi:hypothetical protein ABIE89_005811 [Bradyrhizobium niftali]|uniref:hypothetical protein n=1 Tax=Bradyrhizobium niftali TaxID=2560055 RepID=UPI003833D1AA
MNVITFGSYLLPWNGSRGALAIPVTATAIIKMIKPTSKIFEAPGRAREVVPGADILFGGKLFPRF